MDQPTALARYSEALYAEQTTGKEAGLKAGGTISRLAH